MKRIITVAAVVIGAALAAPAAASATTPEQGCTAYVYESSVTNLCDEYPGTGDVDCKQIGKPVHVLEDGVDPWRLDADGDQRACEKPGSSGGASASPSASSSAGASPSASSSKPVKKSPATSASASRSADAAAVDAGPQLPKTGPGAWILVAAGAGLLLLGAAGYATSRRRKVRWQA